MSVDETPAYLEELSEWSDESPFDLSECVFKVVSTPFWGICVICATPSPNTQSVDEPGGTPPSKKTRVLPSDTAK